MRARRLILRGATLFQKRTEDGDLLLEFSRKPLDALAGLWDDVVVVVPADLSPALDLVVEALKDAADPRPNVRVVGEPAHAGPLARTQWWVQFVMREGVSLKVTRNPREVSYLNLQRFNLTSSEVLIAGDRSEDLGVLPEYPPDLQSKMAERNRRGGW